MAAKLPEKIKRIGELKSESYLSSNDYYILVFLQ